MTAQSGKSIDVDALLARLDIVDVIERYITLKKNGPEYEACCPFHSEKTPSFKVVPLKQFYYCHGCGATGDAIKFVREHRGLSFVEACAELGGEPVASGSVRPPLPAPEKPAKAPGWVQIVPVPPDAPAAPVAHSVRGRPEAVYPYLDAEGRLIGFIYRYPTSDGGKELTPLSYCRHAGTGKTEWRWMAFSEPRPLYGLDLLAKYPNANVLLVEGEKCADSGRVLLDGAVVVITWPGGGKAVGKIDWTPLAGRKMVNWPDADAKLYKGKKHGELEGTMMPAAEQPGIATMEKIAQIQIGMDCPVRLVGLPDPGVKPDGWDIHDAIAEGWDRDRVLAFIKDNLRAPAEPVVEETPAPRSGKKKPVQPAPELLPRDAEPPARLDELPPLDSAPSMVEPDWVRKLMRNEEGRVLAELQNVLLVLRNHSDWKGVIYLDDFSHRVMKKRAPPFPGGSAGEWTDVDDSMTHAWLTAEMRMLRLRTTMIAEAVQAVAALNSHNPLKEHLNALVWDGEPRLNGWLIDYLGAGAFSEPKDTPSKRETDARTNQCVMLAGRMWLIAAVARVFNPGCKFDQVLILEGQQGLGKSSALGIIGGEWFMDTPIPLGDKEGLEMIQGVWIVEMAELDSFNKAESTTAKSFFSRSKDRFRLPYGHRTVMFSRSCIFAGTTNQSEYFSDKTGNRRYWPVMCRTYDRAALIAVRDQLLSVIETNSKFEPVIGKPGDGASPSCAIVDEYHEHKTPELYETMQTGMGARSQPLMLVITTSGTDVSGPCYMHQVEMQKILEGTIENDQRFGIIFTIDEGDDWTSEDALIKANPNYGVSIDPEFLKIQQRDAVADTRKQNTFKTKHLNIWCAAASPWINLYNLQQVGDPSLTMEDFAGEECVAGLDLASTTDIASKVDGSAMARPAVRPSIQSMHNSKSSRKKWKLNHGHTTAPWKMPTST